MKKCKILFGRGCRSTFGLSDPILRRLDEADWCDLTTIQLDAGYFRESYEIVDDFINSVDENGNKLEFDLFLAMADRIEMCAAACAAFHNNVRIAHIYAGILNSPLSTLDDVNRHCITLWSDIAFCEDVISLITIGALWSTIGKYKGDIEDPDSFEKNNIYEVGITHLDDLELDESLVPDEAYDLILINSETTTNNDKKNVSDALSAIENRPFWIGPNPDKKISYPLIETGYHKSNLPRPQFLGLMKNCERYITNSSSAYYEAPQWLKPEQIILIGERNRNRSTPKKLEIGASQKIVDILKKWWKDKNE
jgi:hypothetical protein